jgi:hypothetical protein
LAIAPGRAQHGNRDDTVVYRCSGVDSKPDGRAVMADGGYRGNHEVIMPHALAG